eukprot:jgi/Picsp_1/3238/NSC_06078-R1_---NA---
MKWNENRRNRGATTLKDLRTLNRVLCLDEDLRPTADAQVNPSHREHAQQPEMTGITGQAGISNVMASSAYRQRRDRNFSLAETRPELGRYQQVRGSTQRHHPGPEFSDYHGLQEFELRNSNGLNQNNSHPFGSPMQYPVMDTEPRWLQQQRFVPSHSHQPLSAPQNQGVAATGPVSRGERLREETSIGVDNGGLYPRQLPRPEVISRPRTTESANTPGQIKRKLQRPSNQRAGVHVKSSPAVQRKNLKVSRSPVLPSPAGVRRNAVASAPNRIHPTASNLAGRHNGLSQMLPFEALTPQGPSQIGYNERISSMHYSNLAGNAVRTPEGNVFAARAGGSEAMSLHQDDAVWLLHEESGEGVDTINHPCNVPDTAVRSEEQALPVEHALELKQLELLSMCRKHACSDDCGLYPSGEALARIYEEMRSQDSTYRDNLEDPNQSFNDFRSSAKEVFNKIRSSISRLARLKLRSYRGFQGHVSENDIFHAFFLCMARSKAIQVVLKECYDSEVTGQLDDTPERRDDVMPSIPLSLQVYLVVLYNNVDGDTILKEQYLRLFYSS